MFYRIDNSLQRSLDVLCEVFDCVTQHTDAYPTTYIKRLDVDVCVLSIHTAISRYVLAHTTANTVVHCCCLCCFSVMANCIDRTDVLEGKQTGLLKIFNEAICFCFFMLLACLGFSYRAPAMMVVNNLVYLLFSMWSNGSW